MCVGFLQSLITWHLFRSRAKVCHSGAGHHSNRVKEKEENVVNNLEGKVIRFILFCFVY